MDKSDIPASAEPMGALRHRLAITTGLGVACALLLLVLVFHLQQRAHLLTTRGAELLQQQQQVAQAIDDAFERTEQRAFELAAQTQLVRPSPAQAVAMLEAKLLHDGESVQFGLLLEADNPIQPGHRFAVGEYFDASGPRTVDFLRTGYDYWNKAWYQEALRRSQGSWSEVYFNDAAGGIDTITYERALRDAAGHAYGVVSVSLALDRIAKIAATDGWPHAIGNVSHLLVAANGRILLADDPSVERASTLTAPAVQRRHPLIAWLARQPAQSAQELAHDDTGSASTYVLVPLPRVGWRVAARVDDAQVLQPLWRTTWIGVALALVLGLFAGMLVAVQQVRQRRSMLALAVAVERLGDGQFDVPIPDARQGQEVARLVRALERSRSTLLQLGGQAREARDARLLNEGRSNFAHRLQQALLPEDRVFFGSQLQLQACGALDTGSARDTCFFGHLSPAPGVFVFYLGTLLGNREQAAIQLGRIGATATLAARTASTPAAVLAAVAEQLGASHRTDALPVALLVGRIDLEQHTLAIANAGTGGAVWLHEGRQQVLPLPAAPPLNYDTLGAWPDWHGAIAVGDRLLLVAPVMATGSPLHCLQVAVERHMDLPARDMLETVMTAVDTEAPEIIQQDRALLLLDIRHRD